MGHYIDQEILAAHFAAADLVQLTDDDGDGQPDPEVIDPAISRAEGEFHSYVAKRYLVPVDLAAHPDVAETIRGRLVDLVLYYLQSPPRRARTPEDVQKKYDACIAWLKGVGRGNAGDPTLGSCPAPPSSGQGGTRVASGGEDRRMTRDSLRDL